jgi:DNA ligase-1
MITTEIFKRGTDGKIRSWQVEVEGPAYRVIAGIKGGKLVTSEWKTAKPKNIGKKNETSPEQQAQLEAAADEAGKLKREYRRTIPELDSVPDGPMLAADYAKRKGSLNFAAGVYSQPKLDGIRALMQKRLGATTRELQPHHQASHLMAALEPLFQKYPGVEFDGELYNHDYREDFNGLVSLIRSQEVTDEERAKIQSVVQFHVYDLPSADPFSVRSERLMAMVAELNHPMIVYVPTVKAETQDILDALNMEYVDEGYEGQMVRIDGVEYEFDVRSKSLYKRKDFVTEEFPLLSIESGEGNWGGVAKKTTVQLPNGKTTDTGLRGSKDFARQLLIDRAKYTQATIRHFGYTADGKLRFPVAIDFHEGARVD